MSETWVIGVGGFRFDEVRERVCDWVRANGLDPGQIPEGTDIVVKDGWVSAVEWVGKPWKGVRTRRAVPLVVPPPADLLLPLRDAGDARTLRAMALALKSDPHLVRVLTVAADALEGGGGRGLLVDAVVAFADGLMAETLRDIREAGHPGGPAVCTCTEDEVNVGTGGVDHLRPGRLKPDPACPIHGGGR